MEKDVVYGEKVKLDKKDKKILEQLYKDGRIPISLISKRTGLQRDSIKYRIQKMIKNEVISYILPILNPPKIGYPTMNYVFFVLYNLDIEKEKEFLKYLRANKYITYIANLIGKFDYMVLIASKDPGHFQEIFNELRYKFSDVIKEYDICTLIKEPKYEAMLDLL